jgi:hypothetical protein
MGERMDSMAHMIAAAIKVTGSEFHVPGLVLLSSVRTQQN